MRVSGQLHTVAALFSGRKPCTHRIGDWVDPRGGLDISEKKKIILPLSKIQQWIIHPSLHNTYAILAPIHR